MRVQRLQRLIVSARFLDAQIEYIPPELCVRVHIQQCAIGTRLFDAQFDFVFLYL